MSSIASNSSAAAMSDFDPFIPFLMYSVKIAAVFIHALSRSYIGVYIYNNLKSSVLSYHMPKEGKPKKVSVKIEEETMQKIRNKDPNFLLSLMNLPVILGGYPVINIVSLMIKGFPDPLSESFSFIKVIIKVANPELKMYVSRFLSFRINADENYALLFSNPTSVNLDKPSSPSEVLKRHVLN